MPAAGPAGSTDGDGDGEGVAQVIGRWGVGRRRDLPWRGTRDPWAVLVSEVMLQQTGVARVVPRYQEWVRCWPTPSSLAAAPLGQVLAAWSGLGYNRRALGLHRAATMMVVDHGGRVPRTLAGLLALPGVGPYTARAVLAFAYGQPVGVVDVNAARVLARAVAGRRLGAAEVQRVADALVPGGDAWGHNQAVLDLGATVCTAVRPSCGSCPLAAAGCCAWRGRGPDPAVGSAGTGRPQSTFVGSDRQGRGRLMASLLHGPVAGVDLACAAGWSDDPRRAARVAAGLVGDGLAQRCADGGLAYPDDPPDPSPTPPPPAGVRGRGLGILPADTRG